MCVRGSTRKRAQPDKFSKPTLQSRPEASLGTHPGTSPKSNRDADFNLMDLFASFRLSVNGTVQFLESGFFLPTLSLGVHPVVCVVVDRSSSFLPPRISYAPSIWSLVGSVGCFHLRLRWCRHEFPGALLGNTCLHFSRAHTCPVAEAPG